MATKPQARARPPWKRANPKTKSGRAHTKLSPTQKATAKARAKKAGRSYPNLVDNMRVAAEGKRTTRQRSASKKTSTTRKRAAPKRRASRK